MILRYKGEIIKLGLFLSIVILSSSVVFAGRLHSFAEINQYILSGDIEKANNQLQAHIETEGLTVSDTLNWLFGESDVAFVLGDMIASESFNRQAKEFMKERQLSSQESYFRYHLRAMELAYEWQDELTLERHLQAAYGIRSTWSEEKIIAERAYMLDVYEFIRIKIQSPDSCPSNFRETLCEQLEDLLRKMKASEARLHDVARTQHRLANAYADRVMSREANKEYLFEQANLNYDEAASKWQELYGQNHYEYARARYVKGYLAMNFGNVHSAIPDFEAGVKAFQIDPERALILPNKVEILMCLKYYVHALLEMKISLSGVAEKECLEKARSHNQIALDLWNVLRKCWKHERFNSFFAHYALNPEIEFVKIQLLQNQRDEEWCADVFESFQSLKYDDLKRSNPRLFTSELTLDQLQTKLNADDLFLEMFSTDEMTTTILFISKSKCFAIDFGEDVVDLKHQLNRSLMNGDFSSFASSAQELYSNLFKNIDLSEVKRLIVSENSPLDNIPYPALLCSSEGVQSRLFSELDYFMHHCSVVHVLSASFFDPVHVSLNFDLDVFSPSFSEHSHLKLSELPFSHKLGDVLQDVDGVRSYLKDDATSGSLCSSRGTMIHISSHGEVNDDLFASKLWLSDTAFSEDDFSKIRQVPAFFALNTCNSSKGRWFNGEGMRGLFRPLFKLGTKAMIVNSWEVDDKASNLIFSHMYSLLSQGGDINDALRKAQLSILQQNETFANPYYWAGHRYIGQEIRVQSPQRTWSSKLIFLTTMLPLILLSFLCIRKAKARRRNEKVE